MTSSNSPDGDTETLQKTQAPLSVDSEKLRLIVATAAGCITQGVDDHFQLRAVSRADFRDNDPLMVILSTGATDRCFAVELIDAEKNDDLAVKMQGTRCARIHPPLRRQVVAGLAPGRRARGRMTSSRVFLDRVADGGPYRYGPSVTPDTAPPPTLADFLFAASGLSPHRQNGASRHWADHVLGMNPSIARFVADSSARDRGRAYDSLFTSTDSLDAFPPSQHSPRAREFQMVLEKPKHERGSAPTPGLEARSGTLRGATPSHQEIARAAFCQWQNHGGDAEQNWLTCERQLRDGGSTVDEVASHTHLRRR